jgi:hypothetical protein
VIVFAIAGFAGVSVAADGRIDAFNILTLWTYAPQSAGWLLAMIFTAFLYRKKYSKLKCNLLVVLSFFIFQMICLYGVGWIAGYPFDALSGNLTFLLIGALICAIILYLIKLPFLILAYLSSEYDKRMMNWLGQIGV